MKKTLKEKKLGRFESCYIQITYSFMAFFFAITGVMVLPIFEEAVNENIFFTLLYCVSILLTGIYFGVYKNSKRMLKEMKND